jgi:hypothetical protein
MHAVLYEFIKVIYHWDILYTDPRIRARIRARNRARNQVLIKFYYSLGPRYELVCVSFSTGNLNCFTIKWPWRSTWHQRRLNSRPQSIMGIERLIARVASLTVDEWTSVWLNQYGSFRTTRRRSGCDTLWKEIACYCCIVAIIIMTRFLLYQVYFF